jgi:hypothetical protein
MNRRLWWMAVTLASACAGQAPDGPGGAGGPGGKTDTGWISDSAFEASATVRATLTHAAEGEWAALATDARLQEQIVDAQVKFAKNTMAAEGWHVNQLVDKVRVTSVTRDGAKVTLAYEATVDLLHERSGALPTLESLPKRRFTVPLPVDPVGVRERAEQRCAEGEDGHAVSEYNYYYYFTPAKAGCDLALHEAPLEITEVYQDRKVYPEYDQLLQPLAGDARGFRAAILPNEGDDDPLSRFDVHKRMLERELKLTGTDATDGTYRRYVYARGRTQIVIDLFDPTKVAFTDNFHAALRAYTLVFYNGHSAYGTEQFLTDRAAFSDRYQIVMMHSCRSYEYYARQVFRAKATAADPTGFVLADVVATGESSYPTDSPRTLKPLLRALLDGIAAVDGGTPAAAPTWLSIVRQMNDLTSGILYGASGVRANVWQP